MGDTDADPRRAAVLLRVLVMLGVVALGGILASFTAPPEWRPFALQDSNELGDLLDERPTFEARYGLYTDLRELAAGGTIIVPVRHPLDESALRSISLLSVVEADYASAPFPSHDLDGIRRGRLEGEGEARGTHTPYEIRLARDTPQLQLWFDSTLIVVAAGGMGAEDR